MGPSVLAGCHSQPVLLSGLKGAALRSIHRCRLSICQHRSLELRGRGLGEVAAVFSEILQMTVGHHV